MKNILCIALVVMSAIMHAQPCKVHNSESYGANYAPNPLYPEGISTLWSQPYNPNLPSNLFLNTFFNWAAVNGQTGNLAMIPLSGMNQVPADLSANPYDSGNNYSSIVSGLSYENLDFHWEDGWELLAMNTGYYPNGSNVLDLNEQPLFPNNPTLLFYNKQRGLLRLFSNFIGPLQSNPQTVRITLKFRDSNNNPTVTGLLRVVDNIDCPLNQETEVTAVTNIVNFENNDNFWFYTDFFVGYDPCSCMLHSEIEVLFDLITTQSISLISNTLGVEYDLIDSNGAMNVDLDFLTSTNYDAATGFGQAGAQIYAKMQDLTDQYRLELRKIQEQNNAIDANNAEIEKKLAIIDAIGVVMKLGSIVIPMAGGGAAITGIAATTALAEVSAQVITSSEQGQSQTEFIERISNLPLTNPDVVEEVSSNGNIKIDSKKLFDKGSKILGIGLDSYSKSLKKKLQEPLPNPRSPIAMMQTSTYDGNITEWEPYGSIKLWTPGVYPFASQTPQLSQSTFPVYNEILGLFAVLRDPELDISSSSFNQTSSIAVPTYQTPTRNAF